MLVQRADAVRAICRARWLGLLFAIVQIVVFYPDLPPDYRWALFALVTVYGLANLVLWSLTRRPAHAARIAGLAVGSLALDVVAVSAFAGLYLFDPATPVHSLLFILPLEGALLFQLRGAVSAMSAAALLYATSQYLSSQYFGYEFRPLAVGFRIAIGLIIAAVAGGIASHLEQHRHRIIRSERNLARTNNRLTTLLSNLPGMAYRAHDDERWTLDFVSEGVGELTGYTADEFMARPDLSFEALIHPEDAARVRAEVETAIRERRPFQVEYRLLDRDGVEKWVWEQGRAVPDPDDGIALEGLIIDATDRKRLEGRLAQAQKMEAVGRLAGGIAHDFNNLLSVVTSYAVLVADDLPKDSPLQEDLAEIHSAGKRGADLVRQLLAFSRNQVVVQSQVVDVDDVVRDMTNLLRKAVGEGVRLDTSLSAAAPVLMDRGQLEQILMNLVVNARDAMPDGGTIRIETRGDAAGPTNTDEASDDDGAGWLTLSVVDDGAGIPPDVIPHVFEPFFTTKHKGGGTGLGLATVYGIVDGCGGRMEIRSEVGKGTSVDVRLPTAPRGGESAPLGEEGRDDPTKGHRILLVEDEAPVGAVSQKLSRPTSGS